MKIAAVVVTYNRKELLCECIDALLSQTRSVDTIIVLDNASTDGTIELFRREYDIPTIKYIRMEHNLGGAGGFYEGIKFAHIQNFEWIWVMDDDTIPEPDALEQLCLSIKYLPDNIAFIASSVYGLNGEAMNLPVLDNRKVAATGYADWYRYLDKGLVKITCATFVSVLINNRAIKKVGFPYKKFFIWGDDWEYTLRLTNYYGSAYFDGKSKVLHKRAMAKWNDIQTENDLNRLALQVYYYRNTLVNKREYEGRKSVCKTLYSYHRKCLRILQDKNCRYKLRKIKIIYKGIFTYLLGTYDKKNFKNRMYID